MKRWGLGVLCLLLLGALSACLSPGLGDYEEGLHGIRTIVFDKNGGDTEAVPERINLRLPATTLDSLPVPPSWAGHTFAGWNTQSDGSGEPFTAQTPVNANALLIVYAQWDPPLSLRLPDSFTFTPMADGAYHERSFTFAVTVSGLQTLADADDVELEFNTGNETWFSLHLQDSRLSEGTKTFAFRVDYSAVDASFAEGPASIRFNLSKIPKGYAYVDGPKTLSVATANGEKNGRPIPVHQGNIEHFNRYANTVPGQARHYQLTQDIVLGPPVSPKPSNWTPIGTFANPFTGSFDGDGFRIFDLIIDAPFNTQGDYQGLFGNIGSGAQLKNLGLENVSVHGRYDVGSLVGSMHSGTVHNSYATGSVKGGNAAGGLVGYNYNGTVQNSYATGSVKGGNSAGGLVGSMQGGTVHNSYATGNVEGSEDVGGLVGMIFDNAAVHNSYATGSVEGDRYVGGLVGGNVWGYNTVQNCVALNPSVIATTNTWVGRVIGDFNENASLSGNRALSTMKGPESSEVSAWSDGDLTHFNGQSTTGAQLRAANSFQNVFGNDNSWTYATGRLPGFGETFPMPSHIPQ